MGSSDKTQLDQSPQQIADTSLPDLSQFCVLTLNDYMDGMATEDRVTTGIFSSNVSRLHHNVWRLKHEHWPNLNRCVRRTRYVYGIV